ncbi:MAG: VOC family protein [Chitinophagaceae bacterium]|nr:VOC family protein [Chitinophagaceae bacterium]
MLTIPTPPPGHVSAITITTPDLERSFAFYRQLGFTELMRMDMPFAFIQITDGALLIMLRKDPVPYIALTYYVLDLTKRVTELEAAGIAFVETPKPGAFVRKYVLRSPDGMNISFVDNGMGGFTQPEGKSMLTMAPQDYSNPEKYTNKVCGMFGEFACPVKDLDVSIAFWEKLGFQVLSKMASPYPWAILSDGIAVVGLHQTEQFSAPRITFFAMDMKEKIAALKAGGLEELKETENVSSVTITTPEKQSINLFKLGM